MLGRHTPLVGPYSRYGWSHPGPALFEVLALARPIAGPSNGLLIGAVAVNLAAVVLAVGRMRTRGVAMAGTVALMAAVLVHAMGPDLLMSPWNPWITVLPTFTFLLYAWSLARRELAVLPVAVAIGSFLIQTHVAYGVLVVAVAIAATGAARVLPAGPQGKPFTRAVAVATVAVVVVLWAPVAVDQVAGTGNAGHLVRYFVTTHDDHPSTTTAVGVAAAELRPVGPWVTGPEEPAPFSGEAPQVAAGWLTLPAIALAVAAVVARRRRDHDALALLVVAAAALAASVVAITRITGQVWPYLVRSTWAVAAVLWLAVGRALVPAVVERLPAIAPRVPTDRRRLAAAVAIAIVVLVLTGSMGVLDARPPDAGESDDLAHLMQAVDAHVPRDGVVVVRPADTDVLFPAPDSRGIAAGVIAALHDRGVDARAVADDWHFEDQPGDAGAQLFGAWRLDDGGPVAGTITIVGARKIDTYVAAPGSVELYRVDDPREQQEIHQLEDDLRREFTDAGHPEAVPLVDGDGVRWVGFNIPDLGRFAAQGDRLVTLRSHRREVVYWHPGR